MLQYHTHRREKAGFLFAENEATPPYQQTAESADNELAKSVLIDIANGEKRSH